MIGLDEKSSHIANLIRLAIADGNVNYFEDMFIKLLMARMGISGEQFKEIAENYKTIPVTVPKNDEERTLQFYQLLTLMKMDRVGTPEEIQICKDLGLRMGFNTTKVEALIAFLQVNMDKQVSYEEMKTVLAK